VNNPGSERAAYHEVRSPLGWGTDAYTATLAISFAHFRPSTILLHYAAAYHSIVVSEGAGDIPHMAYLPVSAHHEGLTTRDPTTLLRKPVYTHVLQIRPCYTSSTDALVWPCARELASNNCLLSVMAPARRAGVERHARRIASGSEISPTKDERYGRCKAYS
jgi:hypothetical protein